MQIREFGRGQLIPARDGGTFASAILDKETMEASVPENDCPRSHNYLDQESPRADGSSVRDDVETVARQRLRMLVEARAMLQQARHRVPFVERPLSQLCTDRRGFPNSSQWYEVGLEG